MICYDFLKRKEIKTRGLFESKKWNRKIRRMRGSKIFITQLHNNI